MRQLVDLRELEPETPLLPGIALKLPQLEVIEGLLRDALGKSGQRWYTLDQAYRRKYGSIPGGISKATVRNCIALQPRGGIPDGWSSGRKVWRSETIEEWLEVDDSTLADYLAIHNPGVRVPERIIEANKRHVVEYPQNNEDID